MFHGSIPPELRSIVSEHVRSWKAEDIYVGCSGNFTVERVLENHGARLHGNDVTIYSCAIGSYLAGKPMELSLRDEFKPKLGWLEEYMDTPEGVLACVMLGSVTPSPFEKLDHQGAYYVRMREAYCAQWAELHAKTVAKIEASTLRLASFNAGDAIDWIVSLPKDAAVICYPPFYAGDYESQFKALDEVFEWPEPEYPMLDEGRMQLLIDHLIGERDTWLYGNYQRREDLEPYMVGLVQTTNRGLPLWVYSKGGPKRVSRPRQVTEPVLVPRLGPNEEIGERMSLAPLTGPQFRGVRSQYMNHNIKPGEPLIALAVLVDGKMIGAFALAQGKFGGDAYLLSDFPITGTKYARLARLIVAAALSRESQRLMQRSVGRRCRRISTTAFSQNPVSMKYRGLLKLSKRSDSEDPLYRYQLQYDAEMGAYSLAEALSTWKSKHAKVTHVPAQEAVAV